MAELLYFTVSTQQPILYTDFINSHTECAALIAT
jgi:hypothetical protein